MVVPGGPAPGAVPLVDVKPDSDIGKPEARSQIGAGLGLFVF
jgi:hypothetical protein